MNYEEGSIYGYHLHEMQEVLAYVQQRIDSLRLDLIEETGMDPIEHCLARIKSEESMREKCRRQGLPETTESALGIIHDAIGFRIVCGFLNDVYKIRDHIVATPGLTIYREKDYIRNAKPNGYRSYHLIMREMESGLFVEFQLRTISMDTWAALEHHLNYKKKGGANTELLVNELKRCAEELASTDVSMQTLKDMIMEEDK